MDQPLSNRPARRLFGPAQVTLLRAAGAVLIAKLSTGELAGGDNWFGGQARHFGLNPPTQNPEHSKPQLNTHQPDSMHNMLSPVSSKPNSS